MAKKTKYVMIGASRVSKVALLDYINREHPEVVILVPDEVDVPNLADLKIPEEIRLPVVKYFDKQAMDDTFLKEPKSDYERHQDKMRKNHYKHFKHKP